MALNLDKEMGLSRCFGPKVVLEGRTMFLRRINLEPIKVGL
jgi:hypothetical protein